MYGWVYNFEEADEDSEGNKKPLGYSAGWPYYEQEEKDAEDGMRTMVTCIHEYVNVGFYSVFMCCKHCGIEEVL